MPVTRRKRLAIPVFSLLAALAAAAVLYVGFQRVAPLIEGGCNAESDGQVVPLSTGQAAIAATIAGVAQRDALPPQAVTVAYAAAMQESKLQNLPSGDRDSVGVFQQRPSQGWGTRKQLLNPIFATTRFFSALAAIPGYLRLSVSQAAQDVQRSADGSAYGQYAPQGSIMATGFTGAAPRSVWCWYGSGISGRRRLAAAEYHLMAAFGPLGIRRVGDPVTAVRVPDRGVGWAVACWLVTHAASYRIAAVRFAGYQWLASHGQKGWRKARPSRRWPSTRLTIAFG